MREPVFAGTAKERRLKEKTQRLIAREQKVVAEAQN
jgi:hypothetical protein